MLRQAQHGRACGLALLLAACSQSPQATDSAVANAEHTECALAGAAAYRNDCTVERSADGLVVRHPDGGFRRFMTGEGDNRIRPADGAEAAEWREVGDGRVEVVVGQDRYRFRLESEPADASSSAVPAQ